MISLAEFLKVAASGEQVFIIDIINQEAGTPDQFDDWLEYSVKHFYSLYNSTTKETYTQVEVVKHES